MLMHEVMNKHLLYYLYYGPNLCFHIPMQYSHLRGMSTKQQYTCYAYFFAIFSDRLGVHVLIYSICINH
jgi:hypothetical protein